MRCSLMSWLPAAIAGTVLGVVAGPLSAQFTVPTRPTAPRVPTNNNPSGMRLTPAAPGLPVTTFAPGGSNLLLAPLYRAGINPFGNYGNYPLDYSPNGGYPFVYPGYPMYGYGYGNPGSSTLNVNVPSTGGGYAAPAYTPSYGGGYNPYLSAGGSQATLSTNPSGVGSVGGDGYSPYANPYVPNYSPAGGFMQGVADVTTANANAFRPTIAPCW